MPLEKNHLDQGWAINLARNPFWQGRVQRRAIPLIGNWSKSVEIESSLSSKPQQ